MKDRSNEIIITKQEDKIDASEGLASLADTEGTKSLEDYLKSKQNKREVWRSPPSK